MAETRERILYLLKTKGPQRASALAGRLQVTAMAVRQHLSGLEEDGVVAFSEERRGVGRPARVWRLTDAAMARFPDSHGELAMGILAAMRAAFGDEGLERLVKERTRTQKRAYKARMTKATALAARVKALAAIRDEEGYMAEWSKRRDGSFVLIENHCPICAAASVCQGLCAGEMDLFKAVLGPGVRIERTEHMLEGARRCAYRISPS